MRKVMRKLLIATAMVACVSASAAGTSEKKVTIGAGNADIDGTTYVQYNLGYTSDHVFDNNVVIGIGSIISYGNVDMKDSKSSASVGSFDMDLRVGYKLFDSLKVVAIGSVIGQYVETEPAYGFGAGAALEYQFTKNFAVEGGYKSYAMTNTVADYDYSVSYAALKIAF